MVERNSASAVATFFAPEIPAAGAAASLGEDAAHHMRVRRMAPPERVRLLDGAGTIAHGTLVRLTKAHASIEVDSVQRVSQPASVHLLVPIGDRDRMLWLAEKSAELGATTWRPVLWRRSRSVQPRGEGIAFQAKVRARMVSALEQSGNPWLPTIYPDAPLERALAATPEGSRLVLDQAGQPLSSDHAAQVPVILAVGPEGGFDDAERVALDEAGFVGVSISANVLRFETAAVAGLALVRAMLGRSTTPTNEEDGQ